MDTIHESHNVRDKESLKEYYSKWSTTYDQALVM